MANFPPTPEFIKSLDPNSPINENQVLAGDDWFRFVQQVLENQFPTSEDDSANGWDIALTVKASEVNSLAGITGTVEQRLSIMEGLSPALAYLDVAPTGWTIVAAVDEHSVRLTKGSVATGETGGTSGGTNDFSTQFDNISTADHTLDASQIPAHTHGSAGDHTHPFYTSTGITGGSKFYLQREFIPQTAESQNDTDGTYRFAAVAGDHTHSSVGGGGGHAHSVDLDVKWSACIMIARD